MTSMKVEFYRSFLCPRCLLVARQLKKLQQEFPHIIIETIEVTTSIDRVRKARIKSVPTLKIGEARLTGILLTPAKIRRFLHTAAGADS